MEPATNAAEWSLRKASSDGYPSRVTSRGAMSLRDSHVGISQSPVAKPSGAVPVAYPTLTFLPRSVKVKYWTSTEMLGNCCVYCCTRFCSHGRCCGFSHVQNVSFIGARVGACCADATRGTEGNAVTARPTAPVRSRSRRLTAVYAATRDELPASGVVM